MILKHMTHKKIVFSGGRILTIILVSLTLISIFNVNSASAFNTKCEKGDICYETEIAIPGMPVKVKADSHLLGDYISNLYKYLLYVAGVLAVVVIMVGGLQWITAGGNQSKIGEAKERIIGAIIGLFLALGSYLLLYTLNPELVKVDDLYVPNIAPVSEYCQADQQVRPESNPNTPTFAGNLAECGQIFDVIVEGKPASKCKGNYCADKEKRCNSKCVDCKDILDKESIKTKQYEARAFAQAKDNFCVAWNFSQNYVYQKAGICSYREYNNLKNKSCKALDVNNACGAFACYMNADCKIHMNLSGSKEECKNK